LRSAFRRCFRICCKWRKRRSSRVVSQRFRSPDEVYGTAPIPRASEAAARVRAAWQTASRTPGGQVGVELGRIVQLTPGVGVNPEDPLFAGETLSETLAALLTREPDLGPIPPKVRNLLRSCLEKDPRKRLRDISLSRPAQASLALRPAGSQPAQRRTLVPRLRPSQSPDPAAR
jgi:serine/threonine protein kinase